MAETGHRDEHIARVACPYLGVDPVLPVSLTGHDHPDLEHAVRGRQHSNVQLEELLRVVVVGQSRNVHPAAANPRSLPDAWLDAYAHYNSQVLQ